METENRRRIGTVVLTMAMTVAVALGVMIFTPAKAMAAEKFDPVYYLMNYPDVGMALGEQLSEETLYAHYINYGRAEGRKAYAGAAGGEAVDGISEGNYSGPTGGIVPLKDLPDYNDLKDAMTDAEFEELYHVLSPLMMLAKGLEEHEQVLFVAYLLEDMYETGEVEYTITTPHFSNAYGVFRYGAADDSGCTRAAGLMYEMLGIPWEHARIGYDSVELYHWSIVTVDGRMFIVDPCLGIIEPTEDKYAHPMVDYIISIYGMR